MKILNKLKFLYAFWHAIIYRTLPKFMQNRRGIAAMVIGLVVALVACSVVLAIGLLIHANLGTALGVVSAKSASTTQAENITFDVFTNVYSAYNLSSVVPLVAGAALIIAIIVGAFALRGRTR
jgi:Flp pilus assembly pilin Flp